MAFQKTALASSRAISALLSLPSSPATAQTALFYLRKCPLPRLPLSSWSEPEQKASWYWALQADCSQLKLDSIEEWIARFVVCLDFQREYWQVEPRALVAELSRTFIESKETKNRPAKECSKSRFFRIGKSKT